MTKQMLNGIRVSGKEELADRIYKYFDEINQVPVPYRWSYNLDDIDLEKEDIGQIVYEVVNHKAASQENQDKRAPKPHTRKRTKRKNLTVDYLKWAILAISLVCFPECTWQKTST